MARKIFWGVFSLIVLYVCVALLNFSSRTKLNDALREMGGYTRMGLTILSSWMAPTSNRQISLTSTLSGFG